MTRTELIEQLARHFTLPHSTVEQVVKTMLEQMSETLPMASESKSVALVAFLSMCDRLVKAATLKLVSQSLSQKSAGCILSQVLSYGCVWILHHKPLDK